MHHLVVEDITDVQQLPKIEAFDQYLFFAAKMLKVVNGKFEYEHISFVLGKNYLLSFQEVEGDIFNELRKRILSDTGRVRKKKVDYLLIRMLTAIAKHYEFELEYLRERIEILEVQVMENQTDNLPSQLVSIRKEIAGLRRFAKAQEQAIDQLLEDETPFIATKNMAYLRDVQDHLRHLNSLFDVFRDMLASLMDLHLSNLSQNMNTVMKTLTVISSVFIPLTFLAGIYGMNFKNMPELDKPYGYPMLLAVMVVITISMVFYLRRKKMDMI